MKENELFSFIRTGSAALIAPDDRLVGFRPDSGGFSELSLYGAWQTSPRQYVDEVQRFRQEIGRLQWAVIQDWMCEPFMVKRTGRTVPAHQMDTIRSLLTLCALDPTVP